MFSQVVQDSSPAAADASSAMYSSSSQTYTPIYGPGRTGEMFSQVVQDSSAAAADASSTTYKRQRLQDSQDAPLPSPVDQREPLLDTIKELRERLEWLYQKGHDLTLLQEEIDCVTVQIQSAVEALSDSEPKAKVKKT
jgi:hypothetical protein